MTYRTTSTYLHLPASEDSTVPAYLSRPADVEPRGAVTIGFELFGLTGYVRDVADRLAAQGYTALVPDFYHRLGSGIDLPATAAGREDGLRLLGGLTRAGVRADMQAALEHLRPDHTRVAAVGLSMGGHVAFYAATQLRFDTLVAFYPGWLTDTDILLSRPEPTITLSGRLAEHGTRTLLLMGGADHAISPAATRTIEETLSAQGVDHEVITYPDTPHGFFADERETYRPGPADDAWARLLHELDG